MATLLFNGLALAEAFEFEGFCESRQIIVKILLNNFIKIFLIIFKNKLKKGKEFITVSIFILTVCVSVQKF